MATVLTASNFKINTISFGKHKPNINGGYNIELTVGNGSEEILIQTPKMRAPFGISTDKTNPFKKSLDVSFQGIEVNPSIKSLRELIENVDSLTIDYALKNSKTFFKKELARDIIAEYYYSGIKLSKKEQYSDTFKFKLLYLKPNPEKNLPNGKYLTSFWSIKGEELNDNDLDKGDSVKCLIKPQMLWVANRSFGITWVCTQICIHKQQKMSGYAFKKTGDTDDEAEETILSEDEEYEEQEVEVDA
jgi:Family of unknown function (DUF5871)